MIQHGTYSSGQTSHTSVKQKFERARSELVPAFKSAWFYIIVGLGAGFVLLGVHHLLDHALKHQWVEHYLGGSSFLPGLASFLSFITEHLGAGFVVSAIAVFFYEWGAHIKKTMELSRQLEVGVDKVHNMMEVLELYKRNREITKARGEQSLDAGMKALLGGNRDTDEKPKHLRDSISNVKGLVLAIARLHDDDAWASTQFINFISNHVNVVKENAEALRYLTYPGEQRLTQLTTTTAAEIVTAMMEATQAGDEYMIVSDLPSWQYNQLKKLHAATGLAVKTRNVRVRRVFKLFPGPYEETPREAESILLNHLRDAQAWKGDSEWGRYEIRVLTGASLKNKEFVSRSGSARQIIQAHFGIFMHGQQSTVVRVESPTFSEMVLCGDGKINERERKTFDAIWDAAEPLTDEQQVSRLISEMRAGRGHLSHEAQPISAGPVAEV